MNINLTPAKILALRMLAEKPRCTTKQTAGDKISGRLASLMIREGLAAWSGLAVVRDSAGYTIGGTVTVEITPKGREALATVERSREP
jgi:hypothetical protein